MMSPRPWIATVVVIAAAAVAHADSKNEVRAVTFDEDAGVTRVHVRGAEVPTFTAYKLESSEPRRHRSAAGQARRRAQRTRERGDVHAEHVGGLDDRRAATR